MFIFHSMGDWDLFEDSIQEPSLAPETKYIKDQFYIYNQFFQNSVPKELETYFYIRATLSFLISLTKKSEDLLEKDILLREHIFLLNAYFENKFQITNIQAKEAIANFFQEDEEEIFLYTYLNKIIKSLCKNINNYNSLNIQQKLEIFVLKIKEIQENSNNQFLKSNLIEESIARNLGDNFICMLFTMFCYSDEIYNVNNKTKNKEIQNILNKNKKLITSIKNTENNLNSSILTNLNKYNKLDITKNLNLPIKNAPLSFLNKLLISLVFLTSLIFFALGFFLGT
jgi:hypothetical protein